MKTNAKLLAALLFAIPAVGGAVKILSDKPWSSVGENDKSTGTPNDKNSGTPDEPPQRTEQVRTPPRTEPVNIPSMPSWVCGKLQTLVKSVSNPTKPDTNNTLTSDTYGKYDCSMSAQGYVTFTAAGQERSIALKNPDGTFSALFTVPRGVTIKIPLFGGPGIYQYHIYQKDSDGKHWTSINAHGFNAKKIDSDLAPYLVSSPYGDYENAPKAVAVANGIWSASRTSYDNVRAIAKWVCENLKYDKNLLTGTTDLYVNPDKVIEAGGGVCNEFSKTLTAMLRSQGIPAYYQSGVGQNENHAWVTAWLEFSTETKNGITYSTGSWAHVESTSGRLLSRSQAEARTSSSQRG